MGPPTTRLPLLGGGLLFLGFLMHRALHAPLAKFLELNFALNFFLVFLAPVIGALAGGAGELDEAVLGHDSLSAD